MVIARLAYMTHDSSQQSKPLVIITGCSGLIGARLMSVLASDYRVVGLDVKPPDAQPMTARFYECDLTSDESVHRCLERVRAEQGERVSSVMHLAAYHDFSGEPNSLYDELTLQGTKRLLSELRSFEVEQFVFTSTILVMQPSSDGAPIDESSPTEATWAYPESKLKTEAALDELRGDTPIVILRVAGVYDELGRSPAITEHIKRIHEKELTSYFFPGSARHGQAFVHIDDLMSAMRAVISNRDQLSARELFLISEPDPVTYEKFQDTIGTEIHGREWPTLRIPKPVAKAGAWVQEKLSPEGDEPFIKPFMVDMADAHYPVDVSLAKERLHWKPRHQLALYLPQIVQRMLADPEKWYRQNDMSPPERVEQKETGTFGK